MLHNKLFVVTLLVLLSGLAAAYFVVERPRSSVHDQQRSETSVQAVSTDPAATPIHNPFQATESGNDSERLQRLEADIEGIDSRLSRIETMLLNKPVGDSSDSTALTGRGQTSTSYSQLDRRLYQLDNLIKGGIDPVQAEDIVRQKNHIELQRLALQDQAKRNRYFGTQKYYDELDAINREDISLRETLGDERYDEYLFNSKQNNRIKIASVMLGSAAEQAGVEKDDIVLSYDNRRMFTWQELKAATAEGQLGDFVLISIYRNGEVYSLSVPRGPLGVQLGATRLSP